MLDIIGPVTRVKSFQLSTSVLVFPSSVLKSLLQSRKEGEFSTKWSKFTSDLHFSIHVSKQRLTEPVRYLDQVPHQVSGPEPDSQQVPPQIG